MPVQFLDAGFKGSGDCLAIGFDNAIEKGGHLAIGVRSPSLQF